MKIRKGYRQVINEVWSKHRAGVKVMKEETKGFASFAVY